MSDPQNETEQRTVVLGHFATYRFTPAFWALDAAARAERAGSWYAKLADTSDVSRLYLVQGMETQADVMVWSTSRICEPGDVGAFFLRRAPGDNADRDLVEPSQVLWGLTRPSEYSKAKSAQEIDPFATERSPYLVVYPFTKTADWYLLGRETRQGMMNEHIRIGKQFRVIQQLLLYSFGLQDQEFVVVYETEDLSLFSRLVYDLRITEARRFTKSDTPLHAGVLVSPDEWVAGMG